MYRHLVFALLLSFGTLQLACGTNETLLLQLEMEKRYFEAQKTLERIFINPNIADAEDFKRAQEQFRGVIAAASALPATAITDAVIKGSLFRLGQIELARDNFNDAVAAYEELVRRFPQDDEIAVSARLTIGLLRERTLQYRDAIAAFSEVLPQLSQRIAPQESEAYMLSIPFHFARLHKAAVNEEARTQAYRRAQHSYQTIIAKFPKSKVGMTAAFYLAALLADQEQWQALDLLLDQQMAQYAGSPELPHFIFLRALTLQNRLGEAPRARKLFQDILREYPDHEIVPRVRFETARMMLAQNQNQAARQLLKKVIETSRENPGLAARAQEEIAMSYEREGLWVQALNEYRWLAKEYETLPPALNALLRVAYYYTNAGNQQLAQQAHKDAIAYYQGLIDKYPRSVLAALAQEHIANSLMAQKRWEEAAAAASGIENILDTPIGKISTYMLLGNIYESSGQTQRAVKLYNDFLARYPQHPLADVFKQKVRALNDAGLN